MRNTSVARLSRRATRYNSYCFSQCNNISVNTGCFFTLPKTDNLMIFICFILNL